MHVPVIERRVKLCHEDRQRIISEGCLAEVKEKTLGKEDNFQNRISNRSNLVSRCHYYRVSGLLLI
jgi:hypothetical protein